MNIKDQVNHAVKNMNLKNKRHISDIVNLSIFELSKQPYFKERYNILRLSGQSSRYCISVLPNNQANLCRNQMLSTNYNFLNVDIHKDTFTHNDVIEFNDRHDDKKSIKILNKKDINTISLLINLLETAKELKDYQEKIKEIDKENPDFIYNMHQLLNIPSGNQLKGLLKISMMALSNSDNEKALREKYMVYLHDKYDNGFCADYDSNFIRDNIGFEEMKYLREPIKKIEKEIKEKESLKLFKSPNNESFSYRDNQLINFNDKLKKIMKMASKGHPLFENSSYYILKKYPNVKDREYHLVNEFFYKKEKNNIINILDKFIDDCYTEENALSYYKESVENVVNEIIINNPELNILPKNQPLSYSIKEFDKNSEEINTIEKLNNNNIFNQKWFLDDESNSFENNWDNNESFKGMYYIKGESLFKRRGGDKKVIVSINNDLESVGYLIIHINPNNKIMLLDSMVISKDDWDHPDIIKNINESLKEVAKKNNSKILLLKNKLKSENTEHSFSKLQQKDLFEIDDLYLIGDKKVCLNCLNSGEVENIFQDSLRQLVEYNVGELPNNKKLIDDLKNLEKGINLPKNTITPVNNFIISKDITERIVNVIENVILEEEKRKTIKNKL